MRTLLLLSLIVAVAFGGHIPGLRGYYPEHMMPKSRYSGLEVIENDQSFICPEGLTETFVNGTCHNLRFPNLGVSGNIQLRMGDAVFEDGRGEVDENQVSARLVSNMVADEPNGLDDNRKDSTFLLIFLGQFIDHDFALTFEQEEEEEGETLPVPVPDGDDTFDEDEIEFFRSEFVRVDQIREFEAVLTPWLDLGNVYGDDQERSDRLRTFVNGTLNTTIINDREFPPLDGGLFFCGDIRCEENPQLFAFHVLFLREHNRIARAYMAAEPLATDEEIFQFARLLNINQYQSIIYENYLPYLFGRRTWEELGHEYEGFIEGTDPTVSIAFTSAVYRYGHSGIPNELMFLDADGDETRATLALAETFLLGSIITEDISDVPAIFLGQGTRSHGILDTFVVDGIRNDLFRNMPENINAESGMDLIARNIQRCRDHGCPNLNNYRYLFGLDLIECDENDQLACFEELTGEEEISALLFELYPEFDDCDLWVCGMAEKSFEDSLLGETFTVVMADQFRRLRDGDRIFWELIYEEAFPEELLTELNIEFPARLADVIRNNLEDDIDGGLDDFTNAFILNDVYLAWVEDDTIQIEWADNPELRNNVEEYTIEVTFPNGSTATFTEEADHQYLLLFGLDPEGDHVFNVEGSTPNGADIEIGTITVTTLVADGEQQGDGLIAGLEPAVFGGIIGGVAGGIVLIGAGVFCIKRRNRFKNDDINAQFF